MMDETIINVKNEKDDCSYELRYPIDGQEVSSTFGGNIGNIIVSRKRTREQKINEADRARNFMKVKEENYVELKHAIDYSDNDDVEINHVKESLVNTKQRRVKKNDSSSCRGRDLGADVKASLVMLFPQFETESTGSLRDGALAKIRNAISEQHCRTLPDGTISTIKNKWKKFVSTMRDSYGDAVDLSLLTSQFAAGMRSNCGRPSLVNDHKYGMIVQNVIQEGKEKFGEGVSCHKLFKFYVSKYPKNHISYLTFARTLIHLSETDTLGSCNEEFIRIYEAEKKQYTSNDDSSDDSSEGGVKEGTFPF